MTDTKQKITEAMYTLISEKGYDKTSIGQICELVGINKSSVYYFFKNKEAIFIHIIEQIIDTMKTDIDLLETCKDISSYQTFFLNYGYELIEIYENNIAFRKVFNEICIQSDRITNVKEKFNQIEAISNNNTIKLFNYGVELGAFGEDFNLQDYSDMLHIFINGIQTAINYDLKLNSNKAWELFMKKVITAM